LFSINSGIQKNVIEIKDVIPVKYNGVLVYRIFNFIPKGYIVISADDNAEPLIGYGLNSNFSFDTAPPALLFLLEEYKNEMGHIIEKKLKADEEITSRWEKYSDENYASLKSYSIGTFLLETTWGQGNKYSSIHYNKYCPIDPNTGLRSIAGCTAVALAQILHYWNCLVFPDGSVSHTPPGFSNPLPTVYFYNEDYDWDGMSHNSPNDNNAKLIYHCGVAINVMYTDSSTGGFDYKVKDAMENYFGFQTSGLISKPGNETEWINMLKSDIDAGRPIYYAGTGNEGRHGWVIDGYKTNNTFHCNWGWENSQGENDWYTLSSLNPRSYDGFTSNQLAIIGAEPILDDCSGLSGSDIVCSSNVSYSVTVPTLASVVWSKSGNLTQVGGNTGSTYTVTKGSSSGGSGSIVATIKNSQGQTFLTRTKNVWAGAPDPAYIEFINLGPYYPGSSQICVDIPNDGIARWNKQGPILEYEWDAGNWQVIQHPMDPFAEVPMENVQIIAPYYGYNNPVSIMIKARNQCGWGSFLSPSIVLYGTNCLHNLLLISPNPATGEAMLSIEPATGEITFDETARWDLEVYSETQLLKTRQTGLRGQSAKIQTTGWQEGIYLVRVNYKGEILTGKLLVKK
jgi:hypothetical protein